VASMQRNLAGLAIVVAIISLTATAALGWWNFIGTQMVSRGDIREAFYLAVAFDDYFEQKGTVPSATDVEAFPSRLRFLRIDHGRYLYACGLYGRDLLVIHHRGQGDFDFFVEVGGNL